MDTLTGGIEHSAGSTLHILDPVLLAWKDVIYRYAEVWGWEDVPYWWNERASLSTLAAAAWMAGGIALEEYQTEKGDAEEAAPVGKGRGDLYLSLGGQHFITEAKPHWAHPTRSLAATVDKSRSLLARACAQARAKRAYGCPGEPNRAQRRLGMVFAVPALPQKAHGTSDAHLQEWLSALRGVAADCACWYAAPPERRVVGKDNWLYPGVCLLIKEVPSGGGVGMAQAEHPEEDGVPDP
jgi:hypothetical protein